MHVTTRPPLVVRWPGALDIDEFSQALQDLEIALSNQDIRTLFALVHTPPRPLPIRATLSRIAWCSRYFDADNDKEVEYDEFVAKLCGELSPEREAVRAPCAMLSWSCCCCHSHRRCWFRL